MQQLQVLLRAVYADPKSEQARTAYRDAAAEWWANTGVEWLGHDLEGTATSPFAEAILRRANAAYESTRSTGETTSEHGSGGRAGYTASQQRQAAKQFALNPADPLRELADFIRQHGITDASQLPAIGQLDEQIRWRVGHESDQRRAELALYAQEAAADDRRAATAKAIAEVQQALGNSSLSPHDRQQLEVQLTRLREAERSERELPKAQIPGRFGNRPQLPGESSFTPDPRLANLKEDELRRLQAQIESFRTKVVELADTRFDQIINAVAHKLGRSADDLRLELVKRNLFGQAGTTFDEKKVYDFLSQLSGLPVSALNTLGHAALPSKSSSIEKQRLETERLDAERLARELQQKLQGTGSLEQQIDSSTLATERALLEACQLAGTDKYDAFARAVVEAQGSFPTLREAYEHAFARLKASASTRARRGAHRPFGVYDAGAPGQTSLTARHDELEKAYREVQDLVSRGARALAEVQANRAQLARQKPAGAIAEGLSGPELTRLLEHEVALGRMSEAEKAEIEADRDPNPKSLVPYEQQRDLQSKIATLKEQRSAVVDQAARLAAFGERQRKLEAAIRRREREAAEDTHSQIVPTPGTNTRLEQVRRELALEQSYWQTREKRVLKQLAAIQSLTTEIRRSPFLSSPVDSSGQPRNTKDAIAELKRSDPGAYEALYQGSLDYLRTQLRAVDPRYQYTGTPQLPSPQAVRIPELEELLNPVAVAGNNGLSPIQRQASWLDLQHHDLLTRIRPEVQQGSFYLPKVAEFAPELAPVIRNKQYLSQLQAIEDMAQQGRPATLDDYLMAVFGTSSPAATEALLNRVYERHLPEAARYLLEANPNDQRDLDALEYVRRQAAVRIGAHQGDEFALYEIARILYDLRGAYRAHGGDTHLATGNVGTGEFSPEDVENYVLASAEEGKGVSLEDAFSQLYGGAQDPYDSSQRQSSALENRHGGGRDEQAAELAASYVESLIRRGGDWASSLAQFSYQGAPQSGIRASDTSVPATFGQLQYGTWLDPQQFNLDRQVKAARARISAFGTHGGYGDENVYVGDNVPNEAFPEPDPFSKLGPAAIGDPAVTTHALLNVIERQVLAAHVDPQTAAQLGPLGRLIASIAQSVTLQGSYTPTNRLPTYLPQLLEYLAPEAAAQLREPQGVYTRDLAGNLLATPRVEWSPAQIALFDSLNRSLTPSRLSELSEDLRARLQQSAPSSGGLNRFTRLYAAYQGYVRSTEFNTEPFEYGVRSDLSDQQLQLLSAAEEVRLKQIDPELHEVYLTLRSRVPGDDWYGRNPKTAAVPRAKEETQITSETIAELLSQVGPNGEPTEATKQALILMAAQTGFKGFGGTGLDQQYRRTHANEPFWVSESVAEGFAGRQPDMAISVFGNPARGRMVGQSAFTWQLRQFVAPFDRWRSRLLDHERGLLDPSTMLWGDPDPRQHAESTSLPIYMAGLLNGQQLPSGAGPRAVALAKAQESANWLIRQQLQEQLYTPLYPNWNVTGPRLGSAWAALGYALGYEQISDLDIQKARDKGDTDEVQRLTSRREAQKQWLQGSFNLPLDRAHSRRQNTPDDELDRMRGFQTFSRIWQTFGEVPIRPILGAELLDDMLREGLTPQKYAELAPQQLAALHQEAQHYGISREMEQQGIGRLWGYTPHELRQMLRGPHGTPMLRVGGGGQPIMWYGDLQPWAAVPMAIPLGEEVITQVRAQDYSDTLLEGRVKRLRVGNAENRQGQGYFVAELLARGMGRGYSLNDVLNAFNHHPALRERIREAQSYYEQHGQVDPWALQTRVGPLYHIEDANRPGQNLPGFNTPLIHARFLAALAPGTGGFDLDALAERHARTASQTESQGGRLLREAIQQQIDRLPLTGLTGRALLERRALLGRLSRARDRISEQTEEQQLATTAQQYVLALSRAEDLKTTHPWLAERAEKLAGRLRSRLEALAPDGWRRAVTRAQQGLTTLPAGQRRYLRQGVLAEGGAVPIGEAALLAAMPELYRQITEGWAPGVHRLYLGSAGAGKTELIAGRLLADILGGRLDVGNLHVLLQTGAAQGELRNRIDRLARPDPVAMGNPMVQQLLGRQRGAPIGTMDSWLLSLLRGGQLTPQELTRINAERKRAGLEAVPAQYPAMLYRWNPEQLYQLGLRGRTPGIVTQTDQLARAERFPEDWGGTNARGSAEWLLANAFARALRLRVPGDTRRYWRDDALGEVSLATVRNLLDSLMAVREHSVNLDPDDPQHYNQLVARGRSALGNRLEEGQLEPWSGGLTPEIAAALYEWAKAGFGDQSAGALLDFPELRTLFSKLLASPETVFGTRPGKSFQALWRRFLPGVAGQLFLFDELNQAGDTALAVINSVRELARLGKVPIGQIGFGDPLQQSRFDDLRAEFVGNAQRALGTGKSGTTILPYTARFRSLGLQSFANALSEAEGIPEAIRLGWMDAFPGTTLPVVPETGALGLPQTIDAPNQVLLYQAMADQMIRVLGLDLQTVREMLNGSEGQPARIQTPEQWVTWLAAQGINPNLAAQVIGVAPRIEDLRLWRAAAARNRVDSAGLPIPRSGLPEWLFSLHFPLGTEDDPSSVIPLLSVQAAGGKSPNYAFYSRTSTGKAQQGDDATALQNVAYAFYVAMTRARHGLYIGTTGRTLEGRDAALFTYDQAYSVNRDNELIGPGTKRKLQAVNRDITGRRARINAPYEVGEAIYRALVGPEGNPGRGFLAALLRSGVRPEEIRRLLDTVTIGAEPGEAQYGRSPLQMVEEWENLSGTDPVNGLRRRLADSEWLKTFGRAKRGPKGAAAPGSLDELWDRWEAEETAYQAQLDAEPAVVEQAIDWADVEAFLRDPEMPDLARRRAYHLWRTGQNAGDIPADQLAAVPPPDGDFGPHFGGARPNLPRPARAPRAPRAPSVAKLSPEEYTAKLRERIAAEGTLGAPLYGRRIGDQPELVGVIGSRGYRQLQQVRDLIAGFGPNTVVMSGGAQGVDLTAEASAIARGLQTRIFEANWDAGRDAGMARNTVILDRGAQKIYAFLDPEQESPGTRDMINQARLRGVPVEVISPGELPEGALPYYSGSKAGRVFSHFTLDPLYLKPYPFSEGPIRFLTPEHFYQWLRIKSTGPGEGPRELGEALYARGQKAAAELLAQPTPLDAKRYMATLEAELLRPDVGRLAAMRRSLYVRLTVPESAKGESRIAARNRLIRELLKTGNRTLLHQLGGEARDTFFGVDAAGVGANWQGAIWMELRALLQQAAAFAAPGQDPATLKDEDLHNTLAEFGRRYAKYAVGQSAQDYVRSRLDIPPELQDLLVRAGLPSPRPAIPTRVKPPYVYGGGTRRTVQELGVGSNKELEEVTGGRAAYVGRTFRTKDGRYEFTGGPLGNADKPEEETIAAYQKVVDEFEAKLLAKLQGPEAELYWEYLANLEGKDLVCWDHPQGYPCHVDVLLKYRPDAIAHVKQRRVALGQAGLTDYIAWSQGERIAGTGAIPLAERMDQLVGHELSLAKQSDQDFGLVYSPSNEEIRGYRAPAGRMRPPADDLAGMIYSRIRGQYSPEALAAYGPFVGPTPSHIAALLGVDPKTGAPTTPGPLVMRYGGLLPATEAGDPARFQVYSLSLTDQLRTPEARQRLVDQLKLGGSLQRQFATASEALIQAQIAKYGTDRSRWDPLWNQQASDQLLRALGARGVSSRVESYALQEGVYLPMDTLRRYAPQDPYDRLRALWRDRRTFVGPNGAPPLQPDSLFAEQLRAALQLAGRDVEWNQSWRADGSMLAPFSDQDRNSVRSRPYGTFAGRMHNHPGDFVGGDDPLMAGLNGPSPSDLMEGMANQVEDIVTYRSGNTLGLYRYQQDMRDPQLQAERYAAVMRDLAQGHDGTFGQSFLDAGQAIYDHDPLLIRGEYPGWSDEHNFAWMEEALRGTGMRFEAARLPIDELERILGPEGGIPGLPGTRRYAPRPVAMADVVYHCPTCGKIHGAAGSHPQFNRQVQDYLEDMTGQPWTGKLETVPHPYKPTDTQVIRDEGNAAHLLQDRACETCTRAEVGRARGQWMTGRQGLGLPQVPSIALAAPAMAPLTGRLGSRWNVLQRKLMRQYGIHTSALQDRSPAGLLELAQAHTSGDPRRLAQILGAYQTYRFGQSGVNHPELPTAIRYMQRTYGVGAEQVRGQSPEGLEALAMIQATRMGRALDPTLNAMRRLQHRLTNERWPRRYAPVNPEDYQEDPALAAELEGPKPYPVWMLEQLSIAQREQLGVERSSLANLQFGPGTIMRLDAPAGTGKTTATDWMSRIMAYARHIDLGKKYGQIRTLVPEHAAEEAYVKQSRKAVEQIAAANNAGDISVGLAELSPGVAQTFHSFAFGTRFQTRDARGQPRMYQLYSGSRFAPDMTLLARGESPKPVELGDQTILQSYQGEITAQALQNPRFQRTIPAILNTFLAQETGRGLVFPGMDSELAKTRGYGFEGIALSADELGGMTQLVQDVLSRGVEGYPDLEVPLPGVTEMGYEGKKRASAYIAEMQRMNAMVNQLSGTVDWNIENSPGHRALEAAVRARQEFINAPENDYWSETADPTLAFGLYELARTRGFFPAQMQRDVGGTIVDASPARFAALGEAGGTTLVDWQREMDAATLTRMTDEQWQQEMLGRFAFLEQRDPQAYATVTKQIQQIASTLRPAGLANRVAAGDPLGINVDEGADADSYAARLVRQALENKARVAHNTGTTLPWATISLSGAQALGSTISNIGPEIAFARAIRLFGVTPETVPSGMRLTRVTFNEDQRSRFRAGTDLHNTLAEDLPAGELRPPMLVTPNSPRGVATPVIGPNGEGFPRLYLGSDPWNDTLPEIVRSAMMEGLGLTSEELTRLKVDTKAGRLNAEGSFADWVQEVTRHRPNPADRVAKDEIARRAMIGFPVGLDAELAVRRFISEGYPADAFALRTSRATRLPLDQQPFHIQVGTFHSLRGQTSGWTGAIIDNALGRWQNFDIARRMLAYVALTRGGAHLFASRMGFGSMEDKLALLRGPARNADAKYRSLGMEHRLKPLGAMPEIVGPRGVMTRALDRVVRRLLGREDLESQGQDNAQLKARIWRFLTRGHNDLGGDVAARRWLSPQTRAAMDAALGPTSEAEIEAIRQGQLPTFTPKVADTTADYNYDAEMAEEEAAAATPATPAAPSTPLGATLTGAQVRAKQSAEYAARERMWQQSPLGPADLVELTRQFARDYAKNPFAEPQMAMLAHGADGTGTIGRFDLSLGGSTVRDRASRQAMWQALEAAGQIPMLAAEGHPLFAPFSDPNAPLKGQHVGLSFSDLIAAQRHMQAGIPSATMLPGMATLFYGLPEFARAGLEQSFGASFPAVPFPEGFPTSAEGISEHDLMQPLESVQGGRYAEFARSLYGANAQFWTQAQQHPAMQPVNDANAAFQWLAMQAGEDNRGASILGDDGLPQFGRGPADFHEDFRSRTGVAREFIQHMAQAFGGNTGAPSAHPAAAGSGLPVNTPGTHPAARQRQAGQGAWYRTMLRGRRLSGVPVPGLQGFLGESWLNDVTGAARITGAPLPMTGEGFGLAGVTYREDTAAEWLRTSDPHLPVVSAAPSEELTRAQAILPPHIAAAMAAEEAESGDVTGVTPEERLNQAHYLSDLHGGAAIAGAMRPGVYAPWKWSRFGFDLRRPPIHFDPRLMGSQWQWDQSDPAFDAVAGRFAARPTRLGAFVRGFAGNPEPYVRLPRLPHLSPAAQRELAGLGGALGGLGDALFGLGRQVLGHPIQTAKVLGGDLFDAIAGRVGGLRHPALIGSWAETANPPPINANPNLLYEQIDARHHAFIEAMAKNGLDPQHVQELQGLTGEAGRQAHVTVGGGSMPAPLAWEQHVDEQMQGYLLRVAKQQQAQQVSPPAPEDAATLRLRRRRGRMALGIMAEATAIGGIAGAQFGPLGAVAGAGLGVVAGVGTVFGAYVAGHALDRRAALHQLSQQPQGVDLMERELRARSGGKDVPPQARAFYLQQSAAGMSHEQIMAHFDNGVGFLFGTGSPPPPAPSATSQAAINPTTGAPRGWVGSFGPPYGYHLKGHGFQAERNTETGFVTKLGGPATYSFSQQHGLQVHPWALGHGDYALPEAALGEGHKDAPAATLDEAKAFAQTQQGHSGVDGRIPVWLRGPEGKGYYSQPFAFGGITGTGLEHHSETVNIKAGQAILHIGDTGKVLFADPARLMGPEEYHRQTGVPLPGYPGTAYFASQLNLPALPSLGLRDPQKIKEATSEWQNILEQGKTDLKHAQAGGASAGTAASMAGIGAAAGAAAVSGGGFLGQLFDRIFGEQSPIGKLGQALHAQLGPSNQQTGTGGAGKQPPAGGKKVGGGFNGKGRGAQGPWARNIVGSFKDEQGKLNFVGRDASGKFIYQPHSQEEADKLQRGLSNDQNYIGRNLARLVFELSFVTQQWTAVTDNALKVSDLWRQSGARLDIMQQVAIGTRQPGRDAVNNALRSALPMYSMAELEQLQAAVGSTIGVGGLVNLQGNALATGAMGALTGLAPVQIAQIVGQVMPAFNAGGVSPSAQYSNVIGLMNQLAPGGISAQNLQPISQYLGTVGGSLSYAYGAQGGAYANALGQLAYNAGYNPQALPQYGQAIAQLAAVGAGQGSPEAQLAFLGGRGLIQYTQPGTLGQLVGEPGGPSGGLGFASQLAAVLSQGNNAPGAAGLGLQVVSGLLQQQQLAQQVAQNTFARTQNYGYGTAGQSLATQQYLLGLASQQASVAQGGESYAHGVASYQFNLAQDIARYGPIGADVSRRAYFDFTRNQLAAGYDPTRTDQSYTYRPQQPFGLANEEAYAGFEHQRQSMILGRSKLTADLAFQENLKYVNKQENFYERELELRNQERAFNKEWMQRDLDAQAAVLAVNQAQLALALAQAPFQKVVLEWQAKLLPLQLAFTMAQLSGTIQTAQGLGIGIGGATLGPGEILQSLTSNPQQKEAIKQMMGGNLDLSQMLYQVTTNGISKGLTPEQAIAQYLKDNPQQAITRMVKDAQAADKAGANVGQNQVAAQQDAWLAVYGPQGSLLAMRNTIDATTSSLKQLAPAAGVAANFMYPIKTAAEVAAPGIMTFAAMETFLGLKNGVGARGGVGNLLGRLFNVGKGAGAAGAAGEAGMVEAGGAEAAMGGGGLLAGIGSFALPALGVAAGLDIMGELLTMGHGGKLGDFNKQLGKLLGDAIDPKQWKNLWPDITKMAGMVFGDDIGKAFGSIGTSFTKAFGNIDFKKDFEEGKLFAKLSDGIGKFFAGIDWGDLVKGTFTGFGQLALNLMKFGLQLDGNILALLGNLIKNFAVETIGLIFEVFNGSNWQKVGTAIWGGITGAFNAVKDPSFWGHLMDGAGEALQNFGTELLKGFYWVADVVIGFLNDIGAGVKEVTHGAWGWKIPMPQMPGAPPNLTNGDTSTQYAPGTTGRHAVGGYISPSEGLTLVGESGPELIRAPRSYVYTAGETQTILRAAASPVRSEQHICLDITLNGSSLSAEGGSREQVIAEATHKVMQVLADQVEAILK